MLVLPIDPVANASPEALLGFLRQCRDIARSDGQARLVSISIKVPALDPLAILEMIYEQGALHFYAERPSDKLAIAGAESVLSHETTGGAENRFSEARKFAADVFEKSIAVGTVDAPFGGPHIFAGFTFYDKVGEGAPFPSARLFVPRWQVARFGDTTTAVANLLIGPDDALAPLAERVWRAHGRFTDVRYHDSPAAASSAPMSGPAGELARTRFEVEEIGDYRAAARRALDGIAAGAFNKIVLARALDLSADAPLHPLTVLNRLRERFPECVAFSFADAHGRSFIGASPERLLRVKAGVLDTESLAGSCPRGGSASQDAALGAALLASEKNRREHRYVLESIVRRLGSIGLSAEHPSEPVLRKLANIQHLHTPIRAELPARTHLLDALAALHPTPAVGGSPREAVIQVLPSFETFERGLYAGALGWLDARGDGEFFVGLRSGLIEGARARLYAGAGIVAGSNPDDEFYETELKFRALIEALG